MRLVRCCLWLLACSTLASSVTAEDPPSKEAKSAEVMKAARLASLDSGRAYASAAMREWDDRRYFLNQLKSSEKTLGIVFDEIPRPTHNDPRLPVQVAWYKQFRKDALDPMARAIEKKWGEECRKMFDWGAVLGANIGDKASLSSQYTSELVEQYFTKAKLPAEIGKPLLDALRNPDGMDLSSVFSKEVAEASSKCTSLSYYYIDPTLAPKPSKAQDTADVKVGPTERERQKAVAAYPVSKTNGLGMEFMAVAGGDVQTGTITPAAMAARLRQCQTGDAALRVAFNEPTIVRHYLPSAYLMGRTEVTIGQFRRFVKDKQYQTTAERAGGKQTWASVAAAQTDDHPVTCVSWDDAQEFCKWLTATEMGGLYRLPSETEWEWACRPGWKIYDHRDVFWDLDKNANLPSLELLASRDVDPDRLKALELKHRDGFAGVAPVKSFLPNDRGLYDMVGNVEEWTATRFAGGLLDAQLMSRDAAKSLDEMDFIKNDSRVVRGGSCYGGGYKGMGLEQTGFAGASARACLSRDRSNVTTGFRVLWDDRPGATQPADDLLYSEIDRLIGLLAADTAQGKAIAGTKDWDRLLAQKERAAERLIYFLGVEWDAPSADHRLEDALKEMIVSIGYEAVPPVQKSVERYHNAESLAIEGAGILFGEEREARKNRAVVPVPVDSQPKSRPAINAAIGYSVRKSRLQELEASIRAKKSEKK